MRLFQPYTINLDGNLITIDRLQVMGILNVTPDSFYANSRCDDDELIKTRIKQIVEEGGDIIDVGGYSSRPFADDISEEEEYRRLEKALIIIRSEYPDVIISIDTFRSNVVKRCIENFGAIIVNDISGGNLDSHMYETVAEYKLPYILMHMRGNPATMSSLVHYDNIIVDVIKDLASKVNILTQIGVNDIIIDPGIGFSKTIEQNYSIIANLTEFKILDLPILIGVSRKSMIYKPLNQLPETSLNGTIALNTISLLNGASILRVHDVKAAVETRKIVELTHKELI